MPRLISGHLFKRILAHKNFKYFCTKKGRYVKMESHMFVGFCWYIYQFWILSTSIEKHGQNFWSFSVLCEGPLFFRLIIGWETDGFNEHLADELQHGQHLRVWQRVLWQHLWHLTGAGETHWLFANNRCFVCVCVYIYIYMTST